MFWHKNDLLSRLIKPDYFSILPILNQSLASVCAYVFYMSICRRKAISLKTTLVNLFQTSVGQTLGGLNWGDFFFLFFLRIRTLKFYLKQDFLKKLVVFLSLILININRYFFRDPSDVKYGADFKNMKQTNFQKWWR